MVPAVMGEPAGEPGLFGGDALGLAPSGKRKGTGGLDLMRHCFKMSAADDAEWESPDQRGAEGATPPRNLSGNWTTRSRQS